ncbi:MAG: hypothetical protein ACLTAX_05190 [Waltera sp.]
MMDSLTRGGNTYDILNRYDSDMGTASMVFLEPPSIDQRIIGQYSYFSIIPSRIENLQDDTGIETFLDETQNTVKYIISTDLKWRIRDMLGPDEHKRKNFISGSGWHYFMDEKTLLCSEW